MKPLLEITRQLVIGTRLGDGHLRKNYGKTQLQIAHTAKKKEYVWWKGKMLADDNLVSGKPYNYKILVKFKNKKYPQWRCQMTWNKRLNGLYPLVIQKYLKDRWRIKIGFVKNKGKLRIRKGAVEAKKFLKIVNPYILECMKYKTNLGYKNSRNAELPFGR
ncbi:MAG: hypothetical protein QME57_01550 [Patescibacteria group bacterium]|nr:hypothetical protein [Patescibacteria group bacterium]